MSFDVRPFVVTLALGPVGVLAGCPGTLANPDAFRDAGEAAEAAPTEAGPTCPDVPTTILAPQCGTAGCHAATSPAASLDLVSPDAFARMSGKNAIGGAGALVDPGRDPDKSIFYEKLLATPPFGARMPQVGPLSDASLACVAAWIRSGGASGSPGDASAK